MSQVSPCRILFLLCLIYVLHPLSEVQAHSQCDPNLEYAWEDAEGEILCICNNGMPRDINTQQCYQSCADGGPLVQTKSGDPQRAC